MDKASGVYLTITDSSIQTTGATVLNTVVPMLTLKGELGLNTVTADTLEELLGYDLKYNPNYYGLRKMLESVSYLKVWRLNQGALMANAYFETATSAKASITDAEAFEDITELDPRPAVAVAQKYVGNWQDTHVRFSPTATNVTQANENGTNSNPQTIVVDDANKTEVQKLGEVDVLSSFILYNSSNNAVVAVLKKHDDDDEYDLLKVVDGVVGNVTCGTAKFGTGDEANKLTVKVTQAPSSDTFWNIHTIPETITEWTLTVAAKGNGNYTVQGTHDFSTDTDSDIYWEKVDFGDVQLFLSGAVPASLAALRDYFSLDNGSNGAANLTAMDIDVSVLDTAESNILLMNGLTDISVVNRIGAACQKNKIHCFVDAPAYAKYIDLKNWCDQVMNGEYIAVGARPDQTEDRDGKIIYVYPSVSYLYVLANMQSNYQNMNYPPAGPTYGLISVENLLTCDYALYADEMKTNRINWQVSQNGNTMMWEQRTRYGLDSDLSYIAPVFIVDALSEQLVNFERNFNFRYMTRSDLLTQQSGLTSILEDFVTSNFVSRYTLSVPSFEEAQAAGRTLTIKIQVAVAKDSEVININLELVNA